MLYIYEYPTCSTCKKAKKLLTTHNIEATYFNIKEATPTVDTFKKIIETFDLPLKKLLQPCGRAARARRARAGAARAGPSAPPRSVAQPQRARAASACAGRSSQCASALNGPLRASRAAAS